MKVTFLFLSDNIPMTFPYEPDLENLLNIFSDALNDTILSDVKGNESCIMEIKVSS